MFFKFNHFFAKLFLGLFTIIFIPSCATIFSGTSQNVRIRSNPQGARIIHNGNDTGITTEKRGAKITINRAVIASQHNNTNEQVYKLTKGGYQDLEIRDRRKINGLAFFFDIFFWPGLIIDFATGAIYKYRTRIDIGLLPQQENTVTEEDQPIVRQTNKNTNNSVSESKTNIPNTESIDIDIPVTDKVNPDAIAVVIGNENYSSPDIPDVAFAEEDMKSMKRYLIKTFGYREGNIIEIPNASFADFNRIFGNKNSHRARLYNLVKPGKSDVFVYYSGHGAPSLEDKEGYLIPVECRDPSLLQFEGYSLNTLFDNLSELQYRSLTVVLDACFSGNSHEGMLIKNASPIFIQPKMKLLNKDNTTIFTSSSGDQVSSWYPDQQHSLFTYYFLKGIKGEANISGSKSELSLDELANYILENVPYAARSMYNRTQNPEVIGSGNSIIVHYKRLQIFSLKEETCFLSQNKPIRFAPVSNIINWGFFHLI
ncbi:MAG: caspase family protein [Bacteroidota bacterium]